MPNLLTNYSAQKSESAKLQRYKNQSFGNGNEVFNSNISETMSENIVRDTTTTQTLRSNLCL